MGTFIINEGYLDWLGDITKAFDQSKVGGIVRDVEYHEVKGLIHQIQKAGDYQKFKTAANAEMAKTFDGKTTNPIRIGHRKGLISNMENLLDEVRKYLRDPNEKPDAETSSLLRKWANDAPNILSEMHKSIDQTYSEVEDEDIEDEMDDVGEKDERDDSNNDDEDELEDIDELDA
jgi:hypothetical protein